MQDPSAVPRVPQIRRYQDWLAAHRGLVFDSYDALWRWSVTDTDTFWQSIWDYFELRSPTLHRAALARRNMPGAQWFPGAQVNYAQQVFRHAEAADAAGMPAVISHDENSLAQGRPTTLAWSELRRQAASLALTLQELGVQPGDRVAAYLPNGPPAIIAFLACAGVGAVWSLCAPDMGSPAVLDRFRQIAPRVLIGCDGVRYGGREQERWQVVAELRAALPSVEQLIVHDNLGRLAAARTAGLDCIELASTLARDDAQTRAFEPVWLAFDHPLWIVYSSGTTGLPKPIVHGHGGIVLVHLALTNLHNDIGCSYAPDSLGERFHWYSSTGWVMWNCQLAGLLGGTTCCIFDGNPGGVSVDAAGDRVAPDWSTLWRFASQLRVTFFGAGAAFFASCQKAGLDLRECGDLSSIRALGTTGSPLSAATQTWGTDQFARLGTPDIWWCNMSGGTDFAGAFIGGNRELPLVPGEMQCRLLGCAVEAWNAQGEPVTDTVGELVCTAPIPSMPLYFWGDTGQQRYLSSYFDVYPGVWRHGDWLKVLPGGGCVIYGRSDATINRHGLRMGTSELYSAVEALPEVQDSLVVDLEYLGRDSYMPLFVVLRAGAQLDGAMRERLNDAIRKALSPRFVPNDIFQVSEIPRTLSGKKQELPIKKLLLGQPIDTVVNREAMANPHCLQWYEAFAQARSGTG